MSMKYNKLIFTTFCLFLPFKASFSRLWLYPEPGILVGVVRSMRRPIRIGIRSKPPVSDDRLRGFGRSGFGFYWMVGSFLEGPIGDFFFLKRRDPETDH